MSKYWYNEGEHQAKYEELHAEFVETNLQENTAFGDALCAVGNLIQEWGNGFHISQQQEDLGSDIRYLSAYLSLHGDQTLGERLLNDIYGLYDPDDEPYTREEIEEDAEMHGVLIDDVVNKLVTLIETKPILAQEKRWRSRRVVSL